MIKSFDLFDKLFLRLKEKFSEYKTPFLAGMIIGLLAHAFAFTNKLINHDEIGGLFSKGAGLSSGRWGLDIIHYIFPDFSMPWIYGIISLVLLTVSACYIIKLLGIQNKVLQIFVSGAVISFPSLTGTFSYMFTASSYALAFLLAVVAVFLFIKKSVLYKVLGIACLILSLGIYQPYISIAATLFLLVLLKRILYTDEQVNHILKDGLFALLMLGISLVIYYGITQGLLYIFDVEFNSYASDNITALGGGVLSKVFKAYTTFFSVLIKGTYCVFPNLASRILVCLALLACAITVLFIWLKLSKARKLLSLIIAILLPLSINCMYLFTAQSSIHTLVVYGFVGVYFVIAMIADNADLSKLSSLITKNIVKTAMIFAIIINIYTANVAYLRMYLSYESLYAFYSTVITQVRSTPGYDENSKVALIGDINGAVYEHYQFYEFDSNIMGTQGVKPNIYSKTTFMRNYLGVQLTLADDAEIEKIKETEEFKNMQTYPYYGSIQKIEDYIVIKFED